MRRAGISLGMGRYVRLLSLALCSTACGTANEAGDDVGSDAAALDGSADGGDSLPDSAGTDSADSATNADSDDSADSATAPLPDVPAADVPPELQPDIAPPTTIAEEEPNNGATLSEYNALALGTAATGAIGAAHDADVFRVPTLPGHVYRATLSAPAESLLAAHLTVMDSGRSNDPAGEDYVKMAVGDGRPAVVEWIAMGDGGEGGHFVIVRDDRNLGGPGVGSPAHTYELVVIELARDEVSGPALVFPATVDDALPSAGAVRLYAFDGTEGRDLRADLRASGGMDARLLVFAEATGSWIARNDDRSASDVDPLLDAPLTASGAMLLVVENIAPSATTLGFTLSCEMP